MQGDYSSQESDSNISDIIKNLIDKFPNLGELVLNLKLPK